MEPERGARGGELVSGRAGLGEVADRGGGRYGAGVVAAARVCR